MDSPATAGDSGSTPGSGRSPGEINGNPLQYSCLGNPMDCSPTGSSVHGTSQARIWEWLPFISPGDLPDPGIEPASPTLAGGFFTTEPPEKPRKSP